MLSITKASHTEELEQILLLQQKNLARNVSRQEAIEQGFVTVIHTSDQLQKMHQLAPAILAKDDEKVVGYALSLPISCRQLIPYWNRCLPASKTLFIRKCHCNVFLIM
jgi:hypothetical protein